MQNSPTLGQQRPSEAAGDCSTLVVDIPLSNGMVAIVDATDFDWLSRLSWSAVWNSKTWYARTKSNESEWAYMHRLILAPGHDEETDHKDSNGLNNRRSNLRIATHQKNSWNRGKRSDNKSGFIGVSWATREQKWHSQIWIDDKRVHLGYFKNPIDAAVAYDKAALEQRKEFAKLNFPNDKTI